MKNLFLILIVSILLVGITLVYSQNQGELDQGNQVEDEISDEEQTIGGNRDENGCLIGAGFSWNETEQKCVKEWEQGEEREQKESEEGNSQGIGQQLSAQIRERKELLKEGEYTGPLGQQLKVREMAQNLRELRVNNIPAETDPEITAETDSEGKTKLTTKLNNGETKEIKIMPDSASENALERLRLKVCAPENCQIELKNVGEGEKEKVSYEVQIERHSKILGIFAKKMQVRADVDAETGVVKVHKPWWAFIATEPAEE